jgi:ribonuclease HI
MAIRFVAASPRSVSFNPDIKVVVVHRYRRSVSSMPHDDGLDAFTDGACSRNGTPHARAGYAAVFPDNRSMDVAGKLHHPPHTNNRAELWAVLAAMRATPVTRALRIFSDSRLAIMTMTEWLPLWIARGWRRADGGAVANVDILRELHAEMEARRSAGAATAFVHVRAHTGNKVSYEAIWNDMADRMARDAAASD